MNSKILTTVVCIIIAFIYFPVTKIFFQQDEWLSFSRHILLENTSVLGIIQNAFLPSAAHYTPLTTLSINLMYSLFSLNYISYALVSISLHILAVLLVMYFAKLILKDIFIATIIGLYFGICAAGFQATAWVLADIGTHGATIFALLSLILFLKFTSTKSKVMFSLSVLFLVISLLFKEIAIGLFILLPFLLFINKDKLSRNKKKFALIILSVLLIYILFRVTILVGSSENKHASIQEFEMSSFLTAPIKSVAQTLIPAGQLLTFSYLIASGFGEDITGLKGTTEFDTFSQQRILPILEIIIFITILIFLYSLYQKQSEHKKVVFFGFLFIVLNSFIYVLSPERSNQFIIIDSRNLYLPSLGAAIFLVSYLYYRFSKAKFFLLLLPLIVINIFWLYKELNALSEIGSLRKYILTQIKNEFPNLPEKVIFYTESNTSYFGLPEDEKIMPFQSGFGQTLLIWYYPTEKFSKHFFRDRFLWEITEQGYKEIDGRGFGYFRNPELLKKALEEKDISTDSVISFSWDSKYNALTNTTFETRKTFNILK